MAGQLPLSAFQSYSAAGAGSIQPGPFALYAVPVNSLAPTQLNEGFAEVGKKTAGFDLLTASQLPANLLTDIEPVVIGPGGQLYLTDGHHTFTALENSIYGPANPTVYVDVIANYSNLTTTQFFTQMQANNLLFAVDNGVPQTVNLATGAPLPTTLQGLTSDPYRGLEYYILKNKSSVLFPTTANITGAAGASTPGLDKMTGFYSDFISAASYRGANGGLGLPYLSPGDIALATQWNLNGASATNIPGTGAVTEAQLPGYILAQNLNVTSVISDSTLSTGTLDGNGGFTGITSFKFGNVTVGTPQVGFVLQMGADKGNSVTLSGVNTYNGGTSILAGTLNVSSDANLGNAPNAYTYNASTIAADIHAANGIIFNSLSEGAGTLKTTASFSTARPIAVGGEFADIDPASGTTLTLTGQIVSLGVGGGIGVGNATGESDLQFNGGGSSIIILAPTSGSNPNFLGNLIISAGTLEASSDAALGNTLGSALSVGQIILDGGTFKPLASFNSVRSLSVTSKSTFDTGGVTTSFAGVLNDQQRGLTFTNSAATAGAVSFGSLEVGGALELTVNKATGTGTTVTFTGGITRDPGATLLLTGTTLGTTAKVFSAGSSATQTNGIVPPWIIIDTPANNSPYDFAAYSSVNGYTAFAAYTTAIASSTATTVDKLTGAVTVAGSTAAYAVNVQRAVTISGTGTLTIGDGTNPAALILNGTNGNPITFSVANLALGGSEGVIVTAGSQTSAIANAVSSVISGSGGLTVSGVGMLTLKTASTQTGAITVDSGTLNLAAANAFSSASGVLLTNTKNLAAADLVFNQTQTFSALNSGGTNSTILIDSTGTGGGSTATQLIVGDSKNLSSTISSTIAQAPATTAITSGTVPALSGTAVAGALTKNGTGLLDLSGMGKGALALVAGSTVVVNAGQLRIGGNIFANPNAISVANGAELQVAASGGQILANPISGAGALRLIGGTLQLTGSNSYSGGTFVETGSTLDITTANVSTGNANIAAAGGLVLFDQATAGTYSGVISDGLQMGIGPKLSGAFDKDDSSGSNGGNVTLAAVQTYTGATNIEAGTVTLGVAAAIASSSGVDLGRVGGGATAALALGANNSIGNLSNETGNTVAIQLGAFNLTVNQNATANFGGVISGTGGLIKAGSGILNLTATNTYSGGTSVTGGVLGAASDAALGAAAGGVSLAGGTLRFNGAFTSARTITLGAGGGTLDTTGNSDTVSGVISGSGGLTVADSSTAGTGVLILSGTNTYSGGTTVSSGTLRLGSAGALPGSGAVSVAGGVLDFNGFSQTIPSLSGGGTISLGSASITVGGDNSNTTFSGVLTGTGGLVKPGTGTLILNGVNTYTGGTAVSAGVLEVGDAAHFGATIQGPVTVGAGGTLSGHGTINGSVSVAAGGTLQPGGTIGTLNVGSATFASGSTYTVETNAAGQSNLTIATGTIAIASGANLAITPDAPASSYARVTNYTILQATGGISGTFTNVTSSAATLSPFVTYSGNAASLTLVRNDISLATLGLTPNQTSAGTAIVAAGVNSSPQSRPDAAEQRHDTAGLQPAVRRHPCLAAQRRDRRQPDDPRHGPGSSGRERGRHPGVGRRFRRLRFAVRQRQCAGIASRRRGLCGRRRYAAGRRLPPRPGGRLCRRHRFDQRSYQQRKRQQRPCHRLCRLERRQGRSQAGRRPGLGQRQCLAHDHVLQPDRQQQPKPADRAGFCRCGLQVCCRPGDGRALYQYCQCFSDDGRFRRERRQHCPERRQQDRYRNL